MRAVTAISIILFISFFFASVCGGAVLVAPTSSQILNKQQNVKASHVGRGDWLLLASVDDDHDDDDRQEDCERRDRRRKCRPLKKLEVRNLQNLQFGGIVSSSGGGVRVVINPVTGSKVVFAGVALGGRYGPAEYELQGQPNKRFVITLPREIVMTGGKNGVARITELVAYLPSSRKRRSRRKYGNVFGSFGRDGKAKLLVGGTLVLESGRVRGSFTAPLNVFVDYLP